MTVITATIEAGRHLAELGSVYFLLFEFALRVFPKCISLFFYIHTRCSGSVPDRDLSQALSHGVRPISRAQCIAHFGG